jgi:hypothetical protein
MRKLLCWLLLQIFCVAGFAENPPLKQLGHSFQLNTKVSLFWKAPTNDLPAHLWTYRVLPSEFSSAAISNLTVLGSFTEKDRDRTKALNPIFNHSDRASYRTSDGTRELDMFPNLGWIYYYNSNAEARHNGNGVPKNEKKTLKLAIDYLQKVGIDLSQLATKPHRSDLQAAYILGNLTIYHTNHTQTSFVNKRGVMVARAVDGVSFWAKGSRDGFSMEFGNDAKISRLEILWRKLQRDTLYPVVKPETILKWIRDGKTSWDVATEDLDWPSVKKMTINEITPYYFGQNHDTLQDSVYPFATLKTTVETGQTNRTIYLFCPIIDETKP